MEASLQWWTQPLRCAAAKSFGCCETYHFSDDKDRLRELFPEPHMSELVCDLTYALGEVERFLSGIELK